MDEVEEHNSGFNQAGRVETNLCISGDIFEELLRFLEDFFHQNPQP